jgi:hypothetical protein
MTAKKQTTNDTAFMIWTVVVLLLVFLGSYFMFKNIGTYEYEGLQFTKERFGQIPVYHYYYLYNDKTGQLVQNNIYLRNNPEKNKVPVDGKIVFPEGKFVYISINGSSMENCSQSGIALSSLASFMTNGGLKVKGATLENQTTNVTTIDNSTIPYITCSMKQTNPVIEIKPGVKTEIVNSDLCYNIYFAKCEDILPATEKFIIQSIVDAKEQ